LSRAIIKRLGYFLSQSTVIYVGSRKKFLLTPERLLMGIKWYQRALKRGNQKIWLPLYIIL
jgi:hypothetical protein